jgi:hypothetical protein
MRHGIEVIFIIVFIMISGCTSTQSPPSAYGKLINYQNSNLGIKILYPAGWNKIETDKEIVFLPNNSEFVEGIFINRFVTDKKLEDVITSKNPNILQGREYRLIESHESTVSGYKAIKYVYTMNNAWGAKMQGIGIIISKNSDIFDISVTTSVNNYDKQNDTLNEIINSFNFI